MSQEHSGEYCVTPSRIGFVIIAVLCGGMCGAFVYGLATNQGWVGGFYGALAAVVFLGGFAATMSFTAFRLPRLLTLDRQGAAFKNPPLKILWEDVTNVEVSVEAPNLVVEFSVIDVDKYITQLTPAQRKALRYEADTCGQCRVGCKEVRIRQEMRRTVAASAAVDTA